MTPPRQGAPAWLAEAGERILNGERLSRDDLLALAEAGRENPHNLLGPANTVRTSVFGNAVRFCSIAPGKLGSCSEDCRWCAQSALCADQAEKPRYTPAAEILAAASQAADLGSASFGIVNSGRRPAKGDLEGVIRSAAEISSAVGAGPAGRLRLCASLGELTDAQAGRLAQAGITRYNHNLETSRGFYPIVVTSHTYDDRLATLAAVRRAGLSLCCGGIFGLGETWTDRVDLALTLRDEVHPDVVPLNFLHPMPGTPMAGMSSLPPIEILCIIALFRLALPHADIKIAGGREKNLRDLQSWMFYAGATSCLLGNYLTTAGRPPGEDIQMFADLGLRVVKDLPTAGK